MPDRQIRATIFAAQVPATTAHDVGVSTAMAYTLSPSELTVTGRKCFGFVVPPIDRINNLDGFNHFPRHKFGNPCARSEEAQEDGRHRSPTNQLTCNPAEPGNRGRNLKLPTDRRNLSRLGGLVSFDRFLLRNHRYPKSLSQEGADPLPRRIEEPTHGPRPPKGQTLLGIGVKLSAQNLYETLVVSGYLNKNGLRWQAPR